MKGSYASAPKMVSPNTKVPMEPMEETEQDRADKEVMSRGRGAFEKARDRMKVGKDVSFDLTTATSKGDMMGATIANLVNKSRAVSAAMPKETEESVTGESSLVNLNKKDNKKSFSSGRMNKSNLVKSDVKVGDFKKIIK